MNLSVDTGQQYFATEQQKAGSENRNVLVSLQQCIVPPL